MTTEGTLKHLHKLTRTKLVEDAAKYPEIVGAHGMSKEQLVEAVGTAMKAAGEFVEEAGGPKPVKKKVLKIAATKADMKKKVKDLRKKRDEALAKKDAKASTEARVKMSRLKGRLRRFKKAIKAAG